MNIKKVVNVFTSNITEALDEIAPVKTFTVKTHHKFGLSDATKKIMSERDNCRTIYAVPLPVFH